MNYRRLGKAGIKLSELSLGAWVTYGGQVALDVARECMAAAYDAGVNFFDNAEAYAGGDAERVMGDAIRQLGWRRESVVVSTKIFWGGDGPNDTGLSHKHIIEGVNNALRRFQMDYVDLVFCHRPDPNTPIEETVRAMNIVIKQGKAFYWGTSEWSAAEVMRADAIARQYGLTPPTMEQPQYNMFTRERFEREYAHSTGIWGMARPSSAPSPRGCSQANTTMASLRTVVRRWRGSNGCSARSRRSVSRNSSSFRASRMSSAARWRSSAWPGV